MIDSPMLGFSSTEVADRLEAGKSVRYLVPDAVLTYIQDHRLYQNDDVNFRSLMAWRCCALLLLSA